MIRLEGVTKLFSNSAEPAVTDLTLEIPRGEIVVLIGPSGCGKSTTLKMINLLIEPSSGTIEVDGTDTLAVPRAQLRQGMGYVIQHVGLFPHRTVAQNIATVPREIGWDKKRTQARVEELIDIVGLEPALLGRYPSELSGGQQQRVGVARALAADPPLLLMDEPYSAVDPIVRARLQEELVALQKRVQKTIVFVTHDIDEAIKLGDRLAILNTGGILEQYDRPANVLASPANSFVEDFVGDERGLKRLSLIKVGKLELAEGPVVAHDADIAVARAVMADHGVDWIGIRDGASLLGWSWAHDLDAAPALGSARRQPFDVSVGPDSSLRAALDAIIMSRTLVAVVCDPDGGYEGMLMIEAISEEVTR